MPTSQLDAAEPTATSVACPQLLTPPPESDDDVGADTVSADAREGVENGRLGYGASDNTAHGMAYEQEMSMYAHHEDNPAPATAAMQNDGDKEKLSTTDSASNPEETVILHQRATDGTEETLTAVDVTPSIPTSNLNECAGARNERSVNKLVQYQRLSQTQTEDSDLPSKDETDAISRSQTSSPPAQTPTIPPQHLCTAPYPSAAPWDFTQIRQSPHYPSSLLRPGSKFTGSQQSDRQIYNVDVDILTVDTSQSSLTGYLRICGLTEDHPTLTTFFSGEIIGGPTHKYSFRTRTATWGATDKTDLIHWARFPAWRSMSKEAKRDIDFQYPLDGGEWWQEENVYMRWKEHFLVPDHRVRSIAGASFEGFYYATFNQVEGRISGIYFHAKSERYQQLELKHVFDKGVCPSMEFR